MKMKKTAISAIIFVIIFAIGSIFFLCKEYEYQPIVLSANSPIRAIIYSDRVIIKQGDSVITLHGDAAYINGNKIKWKNVEIKGYN